GPLFGPWSAHPAAVAALCLAAGFLAAGARAHLVAAPVLAAPYAGAVQGRVVGIDRSASDALRVTLDRVVLTGLAVEETPARVRLSLREGGAVPQPGQVVLVAARLAAPAGPADPGGFDFRRMAWFQQLGGVGYATGPLVLWQDPAPREQLLNRLRRHLAQGIMAGVPGDAGAFAAGVLTGDRSGLSQQATADLRDSGLSHLLAISGMNMAFLVAFVFALVRHGLALVPPLALRVHGKKVAAVVALAVAAFYLALSGANVATERAFVMVAVMLGAVLADRRAISLRSVAIAALVLLLWKPESLLAPGFQMSFAATLALIVGFQALQDRPMPGWARWAVGLVASSVLGGLATAPFAAATFNRFADFGLLANLLTVPVMGAVVMPAGAVAAILAPLGLAALPLFVLRLGCDWILLVAAWVAGWEGAVTMIRAPGPGVLPVLALGGLWLALVPGRARLPGLVPLAAGLVLWSAEPRPAVLISAEGGLVGLMGPEGRALSDGRAAGFVARGWLENDGDAATPAQAAARPGFQGPRGARRFQVAGLSGVVLRGQGALADLPAACAGADLVILAEDLPAGGAPAGCRVFDRRALVATGAMTLQPVADGVAPRPMHLAT
ncbi:MAG: ComEC/Rec2 family competence protein, partial [Rhodobacterales bacterium]|nr:ComEC/Rec2 family competence protein [Rhodobacterales bacterium]